MLHEGILHKCIKQLLEKKKNAKLKDMSEDLECLCQIMRTIGPRIDTAKARVSRHRRIHTQPFPFPLSLINIILYLAI